MNHGGLIIDRLVRTYICLCNVRVHVSRILVHVRDLKVSWMTSALLEKMLHSFEKKIIK